MINKGRYIASKNRCFFGLVSDKGRCPRMGTWESTRTANVFYCDEHRVGIEKHTRRVEPSVSATQLEQEEQQ